MADGRYLEKTQIRNISTTDGPILTKFGTVTCLGPPDLRSDFAILKIQDGGQ